MWTRPMALMVTLTLLSACSGGDEPQVGSASSDIVADGGCTAAAQCPQATSPCQRAICAPGGACGFEDVDGAPCDDGELCTSGDRCAGGACVAGQDLCDCDKDSDCAALEDGDACNGTLVCDTKGAKHRCVVDPATVVTCDATLDSPCQVQACNSKTGACEAAPAPDGTACVDDEPCTVDSVCKAGKCVGSDKSWCECQSTSDCASLEDGDLCTGTLYCDLTHFPHVCRTNPASVVTCATGQDSDCVKNTCDPKTGTCAMKPTPDGTPCDDGDNQTLSDVCGGGTCGGTVVKQCGSNSDCAKWEDGDACNGTLYCDKSASQCKVNPSTVVSCKSASDTACRKNTCDPKTGGCVLQPVANGTVCDDGDACTSGDVCWQGGCEAGTFTCLCKTDADCASKDDGNVCNGVFFCNKATGKCAHNPASIKVCPTAQDTACAKNACDPADGKCKVTPASDTVQKCDVPAGVSADPCRLEVKPALAQPKVVPCSDGNACTAGDVCVKTVCKPGKTVCVCQSDADCPDLDGDVCNGTRYCDKSGKTPTCKDNKATAIVCSAKDDWTCEKNTCHPKTGLCQLTARNDGAACDDGEPCTIQSVCKAGACVAGGVNACDDGDKCTEDACKPGVGCTHKAVVCDDGNVCTVEACDKASGQCSKPTPVKAGSLCNADNDPCTAGDACQAGTCKPGTPVTCADSGNPCLESVCKAQSLVSFSCVAKPRPDATPCPSGDKGCWYGSQCQAGQCKTGLKSLYGPRLHGAVDGWTHFTAVARLGTGFVAVGGRAVGGHSPITDMQWIVMRFDAQGEPVWAKPVLLKPGAKDKKSTARVAKSVQVAADGTIRVLGTGVMADGQPQATLVVLKPSGDVVKTEAIPFDTSARGFGNALARLAGGTAVVGGGRFVGTNPKHIMPALVKLGPTDKVVAVLAAGVAAWGDQVAAVDMLDSGEAVAVVHQFAGPTVVAQVLMLDADGKLRWQQPLGPGKVEMQGATVRLHGGAAEVRLGYLHGNELRTMFTQIGAASATTLWQHTSKNVAEIAQAELAGHVITAGRDQGGAFTTVRDALHNLQQGASQAPISGKTAQFHGVTPLGSTSIVAVGWTDTAKGRQALVSLRSVWGHTACGSVGKCVGVSASACDDGKACTRDRCVNVTGCVHEPQSASRCPPSGGCALQARCLNGACKNEAAGKLRQTEVLYSTGLVGAAQNSAGQVEVIGKALVGSTPNDVYRIPFAGGLTSNVRCELTTVTGGWTEGGWVIAYGVHKSKKAGFCRFSADEIVYPPAAVHALGTASSVSQGFGAARTSDGAYWYGYRDPRNDAADLSVALFESATGTVASDQSVFAKGFIEAGSALIPSANGGVWIAGSRVEPGKGGENGLLARITRSGPTAVTVWQKTYDLGHAERVDAIAETGDGGLLAVGASTLTNGVTRGWVLRTKSDGTQLWSQVPGQADDTRWASVVSTGDGLLTLAGNRSVGGVGKVRLRRITGAGTGIWDRLISHAKPGMDVELATGGMRRIGGTYYLAGKQRPKGGAWAGWMARVDAWGHADCDAAGKCGDLKPADCNDNNPCTADVCNAASGKCVHVPLSAIPCGPTQVCSAGVCK